jgi:uncharacterized membrane protein
MGIKFNHFCLVAGIALIVLALSVFAHAQTISLDKTKVSDFNKFVDLRYYATDWNKFTLLSQSNVDLLYCFIDNNIYLSCEKNNYDIASTTIAIRSTDKNGVNTDFNILINVVNVAPMWYSVPTQCINESQSELLDLREFAYDVEDGNSDLEFSVEDQSNSNELDCSIDGDHYLSCDLSTNKNLTNDLNIKVIDSNGKYSFTNVAVKSNCFDVNGDPNGDTQGKGIIYLESDTKNVCLADCASTTIPVTVINNTLERKCFNFATEVSPHNLLNVSVVNDSICLNPMESTQVQLSANSCNAEDRTYKVRLYEVDTNIQMFFDYRVGGCETTNGFRIVDTDGLVCAGEEKAFTVYVRNLMDSKERVQLNADNVLLLPYFENSFVDLLAGQQKTVQLIINAKYADTGDYTVDLLGDAGDYHISKTMRVSVVDCSDTPKRTFALTAPNVCYDALRGKSLESQFTITSQVLQTHSTLVPTKQFYLSVLGMSAEISQDTVSLGSGKSKSIPFTIFVPTNAPAGHQYITVSARDGESDSAFTDTKNICINVLGEDKASLIVLTQSKDISWCGTGLFELQLVNNGDFDANYTLSTIEAPTGVSVTFSENRVFVAKGSTKTIYVSVSTSPRTGVKDNQSIKIYASGPVGLTSIIYFNVKEKTALDDLEILSSPTQVTMNANSTTSYDLVVRNSTTAIIRNVTVLIENLPNDVNADPVIIPELLPGVSVSVSGTIKAGDANGVFNPAFVLTSSGIVNKAPFQLTIHGSSNSISGLFTGIASGLFALNGTDGGAMMNIVGWSIIWAIILIVLVAVIIYAVKVVSKQKTKQDWSANNQN